MLAYHCTAAASTRTCVIAACMHSLSGRHTLLDETRQLQRHADLFAARVATRYDERRAPMGLLLGHAHARPGYKVAVPDAEMAG